MQKRGYTLAWVIISVTILFLVAGVIVRLMFYRGIENREDLVMSEMAEKPLPVRNMDPVIRPASVAGQFYPADPAVLYDDIDRLMNAVKPIGLHNTRAVLVPHAGLVYSGITAAKSFSEVQPDFRRVFILASNHNGRTPFRGVSIPDVSHFAIPGVNIPLSEIVDELKTDPLFVDVPGAHQQHMIEIELPFLHYLQGRPVNPGFAIIPMILGSMDGTAIEHLTDLLESYSNEETLFVFSVDLSHFYTDAKARKLDLESIEALLGRDMSKLPNVTTDGNQVLMTLSMLALRQGWEPSFLEYRNSGDVSGDRSRVVGYGSIVFSEPLFFNDEERAALLQFAREVVESQVTQNEAPHMAPELLEQFPIFRIPRGVFVTLKKGDRLRGCIGRLISTDPIFKGVRDCAIDSAIRDSRFPPVGKDELKDISLSISFLDYPGQVYSNDPLQYPELLRPGQDGVILVHKGKRSTFLPQVWNELPDPVEFLSNLCKKQGSPPDAWKSRDTVLYRYGAYVIEEDKTL